MRKGAKVLAVAGIAASLFSLPSTAFAGEATAGVQGGCVTNTNNTTFAEAQCWDTGGRSYRVVATYCRVACTTETGAWVREPAVSVVEVPSGGSLLNVRPELSTPTAA
ncbi:hypothetical protein [Amycolatopsis magusensis]|uniref:Secreted protein n=1 Tax=Amycolatopsis magusensis TaxID=882444 RepID=A0ABS4PYE7_9PSEU|nr:hypothetical protein [Amycolatopsis magusensis]MBP2183581.1 hypothetical protein [Amycolatopsis magusensis]